MKIKSTEILIMGAGLTGLTLAYILEKKNIDFTLVEARKRIGGRIHTDYRKDAAPIETGATWLGDHHSRLKLLLKELNLNLFEQKMGNTAIYEAISTSPHQLVNLPYNPNPSFRIINGSSSLIHALAKSIPAKKILNSTIIESIKEEGDELIVASNDTIFKARKVISTLPPNLLVSTIKFSPKLNPDITDAAKNTHTWMGESIKIGLRYENPFWRNKNTSGTIVSNVGPIPEMYDHSNYEDNYFALKGFLNSSYYSLKKEERLRIILNQLNKYYGDQANDFIDYQEVVWRNDKFTFHKYNSHILPHQNNGSPIYKKPYLNGKLFIGGAETASQFSGYMEGAVRSADYIFKSIF